MEKAAQTNGFKVGQPLIIVAANPKDSQVIKLKWDNLTVTKNLTWLSFNFPHAVFNTFTDLLRFLFKAEREV